VIANSDDVPHQGHPGECQQEIAKLLKRIEAVMEANIDFWLNKLA
jgi:hypothetical protein